MRFSGKDRKRPPDYWTRFGQRASALSGTSRKAVNPANAMLNYLYTILQAEARIAALAVGLDPMLRFLHTDARSRDSLACDLMEPVRAEVDRYLLDLLTTREFTKDEFFELGTGETRLLPPLTFGLCQTAPQWARAMLPIAQDIARRLAEADADAHAHLKTGMAKSGARSAKSPVGGKGTSTRPRRGQRQVTREFQPVTAIAKGETQDPRRSKAAGAKRRASMLKVRALDLAWEAEHEKPDPSIFRTQILPNLQGVPDKILMRATGLSKGAVSMIRAGQVVPHPRHWESLSVSPTFA